MLVKMDNRDFDEMNRLGRSYANERITPIVRQNSLNQAAILFAAASPSEQDRLMWWWEEGVRDYAAGQFQMPSLLAALRDKAFELQTKEQHS